MLITEDISSTVLLQIIGATVSPFKAVTYGQLWYRELEKCKVMSLCRASNNSDKKA